MEMTKVSFDTGLDKDAVHIYYGLLLSHKKDEILPLGTTWIDLENIVLSKIN